MPGIAGGPMAGPVPPERGPAQDEGGPAADAGPPGLLATAVPAVLFLVLVAFMAVDLFEDVAHGATLSHLTGELLGMLVGLAGLAAMWRLLSAAMRRNRDLEVALDGTRADLRRWRGEAQEVLRGLGAAIDQQFGRWGLSPAEREVGLLLLKGLSLKEAAAARRTSERTVRQQALAIYRKAGLSGRAELAAFFLQDLLLPRDGGAAAGLASGPGRG